jgi:arginase family enzyme
VHTRHYLGTSTRTAIRPTSRPALHLRILDLDDSLSAQRTLREVVPWASVETVPMHDLAQGLRLWSRAATMQQARERLAAAGASDPATTMVGSGDFHHLAVLLMERAREPVTVVHFDNHPDWVRWAPHWHCGSWVNAALKLGQVAKVITLGPCSDDLVTPQFKGANLRALATGKIVLLPWRHAPSRVWRRIADGPGHRCADGHLYWRNLADASAADNLALVLNQIDTDAIWLTIDKDVLPESEALTNWDQGQMPLRAIVDLIAGIGARKRIIGADICGEYSAPVLRNPFKRIESRIDRPQRSADDSALMHNEAVNRDLLTAIWRAAA